MTVLSVPFGIFVEPSSMRFRLTTSVVILYTGTAVAVPLGVGITFCSSSSSCAVFVIVSTLVVNLLSNVTTTLSVPLSSGIVTVNSPFSAFTTLTTGSVVLPSSLL